MKKRSTARQSTDPVDEKAPRDVKLGVLADDVLVFRIRRIRDLLTETFRRSTTEGRGLRAGEFSVLALIDANPGISQADLARTAGLDQSVLVGILDDLESHGWAVRKRDRADRRRHMVEITADGQIQLNDLLSSARINEAPARDALPADEFQAFQRSLDKIYRALFSVTHSWGSD